MAYDVLIAGGEMIDGTGAPRRPADIGIDGGRVAAVLPPGSGAAADRSIDAEGLVVSPGFVDLHTHYDAQLLWDPWATPSPLHGVTTVFGGNCGFGLAPAATDDIDYLARLMARVEGIPLAALDAGVSWDWDSFGGYLDRLDGEIAVNAGFLMGHSGLRRSVMGAESVEREASTAQVDAMAALLDDALAAGAIGFSTSQAPTHRDGDGAPVPSRLAGRDELVALAGRVGGYEGTQVELIVAGSINGFSDDEIQLLTDLSLTSGRSVNWNVLAVTSLNPTGHIRQLEASSHAEAAGARVTALTIPQGFSIRLNFGSGIPLDALPGWGPTMSLPVDERCRALSDPDVRRKLDEGAHSPDAGLIGALANWEILTFFECHSPETKPVEGRTVAEVAAEQGKDPFDILLDVVVADRLRTVLQPPVPTETPDGWQARADTWASPYTVVGGSDAGAHLDMFCGATYSTFLVGEAVRDLGLLTLEEAVRLLSDEPARFYGLTERGRIEEGWAADVIVFDPATVAPHVERTTDDLPGGASRLFAGADGMHHVVVNGEPIVTDGALTDATPGSLLRSGRDTDTVPIPRDRQR